MYVVGMSFPEYYAHRGCAQLVRSSVFCNAVLLLPNNCLIFNVYLASSVQQKVAFVLGSSKYVEVPDY